MMLRPSTQRLSALATECLGAGDRVPSDRLPMATECPGRPCAQCSSSAKGPEINSNQTEGRSQAIAGCPVEVEKEIWFKKRF